LKREGRIEAPTEKREKREATGVLTAQRGEKRKKEKERVRKPSDQA